MIMRLYRLHKHRCKPGRTPQLPATPGDAALSPSPIHPESAFIENVQAMLLPHENGLIRLTLADIQNVRLNHLISGLDEDAPAVIRDGALPTVITGYTEWVSDGCPAITIGWDWKINTSSAHVQLQRISEPRSNLMIQDISQPDQGQDKSSELLGSFIDGIDWQSETLNYINARYSK